MGTRLLVNSAEGSRAAVLDIRTSLGLRSDALGGDCLHPALPWHEHIFQLLQNLLST